SIIQRRREGSCCGADSGVVDDELDVAELGGHGGDLVCVGDVELDCDEPGIGHGRDVAHRGVDLRRATLEQRFGERLADPSVGASDERGGSVDLHGVSSAAIWMTCVILAYEDDRYHPGR